MPLLTEEGPLPPIAQSDGRPLSDMDADDMRSAMPVGSERGPDDSVRGPVDSVRGPDDSIRGQRCTGLLSARVHSFADGSVGGLVRAASICDEGTLPLLTEEGPLSPIAQSDGLPCSAMPVGSERGPDDSVRAPVDSVIGPDDSVRGLRRAGFVLSTRGCLCPFQFDGFSVHVP